MLVSVRGGPFAVGRALVARRAAKMLAALALGDAELSVVLCDDDTMRRLNRAHRRLDRPTDVLAFAQRESPGPAGDRELLGDVVIAVPTAARQARRGARGLADEVTLLLAHGLLHLVGHDHATAAEERAMRALTAELVAAATRRTTR